MSEWQPIETAPKDGSRILVFNRKVYIASWSEEAQHGEFECAPGWQVFCPDDYWYAFCVNPTHWMPLPEPPQ